MSAIGGLACPENRSSRARRRDRSGRRNGKPPLEAPKNGAIVGSARKNREKEGARIRRCSTQRNDQMIESPAHKMLVRLRTSWGNLLNQAWPFRYNP
jgi:hypothetical protein